MLSLWKQSRVLVKRVPAKQSCELRYMDATELMSWQPWALRLSSASSIVAPVLDAQLDHSIEVKQIDVRTTGMDALFP
jgi:hypothetical protein